MTAQLCDTKRRTINSDGSSKKREEVADGFKGKELTNLLVKKKSDMGIWSVVSIKTKSTYEVLTEGISVSPMSIPKISAKVTGCPEAFLVHRAWI